MYILNDDIQNYPFCRLKLVIETLNLINQLISLNSLTLNLLSQRIRTRFYKTLGTRVLYSPLSPPPLSGVKQRFTIDKRSLVDRQTDRIPKLYCSSATNKSVMFKLPPLFFNKSKIRWNFWDNNVPKPLPTTVLPGIWRYKTMDEKLIYIPNDNKQDYPCCRLICLVETFAYY